MAPWFAEVWILHNKLLGVSPMEEKTEAVKTLKMESNDKAAIFTKPDVREDAYLQINQASFQENFDDLIGHYQSSGDKSQAA